MPSISSSNTNIGTSAPGIVIKIGSNTLATSNTFIRFRNGAGLTQGTVSSNGATGVNYVTTSDARLKTNIVDFDGGLDMVSRINVKKYEFIAAPGKETIGLLLGWLF